MQVLISDGQGHFFPSNCGGTLVGPTKVVTAGHCISGVPAGNIYVQANDKTTFNGSQSIIQASSIALAPSYVSSTETDVGLVTLSSAPSPATSLQVLKPSESSDLAFPSSAFVAGWGATSSSATMQPPSLLQGQVTLQDTNVCGSPSQTLCSATITEPCLVDSGDPVIVQVGADTVSTNPSPANGTWRLVAIPLFGNSNCTQTVYADLTQPAIRDFISPPVPSIKIGMPKLNKKHGTAKLPVTVSAAGTVKLSGSDIKSQTKPATRAGKLSMTLTPTGALRTLLKKTGKAKAKAKVTFTPGTGHAVSATKKVKLVEKP